LASVDFIRKLRLILLSKITQWLRDGATSQEIPGSIPDGVIGIFPSFGPGVDSACNTEYQEYFLAAKGG